MLLLHPSLGEMQTHISRVNMINDPSIFPLKISHIFIAVSSRLDLQSQTVHNRTQAIYSRVFIWEIAVKIPSQKTYLGNKT